MIAKMKDDNVILDIDPEKSEKVSLITYFLVTMFGTGSWVAMNGIWVELPNLVYELPEGWTLPSYLAVICQLANIGPIVYTLLHRYSKKKNKLLHVVVYLSLSIGILACLLLMFTWRNTTVIDNKERSVALLISTFLVALVDCTSSVTFLPYMAIFPSLYMSPFYVGETMSGLLPGLLALMQGVEKHSWSNHTNQSSSFSDSNSAARDLFFPQEMFFGFLAFLMAVCLLAFICLNKLPKLRPIYLDENSEEKTGGHADDEKPTPFYNSCKLEKYGNHTGLVILLCVLVLLNAFQNGITASVSSYTYAPFGSVTYHLAATLGSISSALACFLYLWYPCRSKRIIYIDTILYTLFVIYIVVLAAQSPNPWLKDTTVGKVVMVLVSIFSGALVSFTKLAIASVMKDCGQRYLFWAGVSNQVGSFIGAVVMFPLVNCTNIFHW